ncbi:MAG: T9SS type A sorting domain-containing protein [Bacteroidota bacterium]|nr:T9SS type A sorting domain-containing protein [Bacteroidota bacterium]
MQKFLIVFGVLLVSGGSFAKVFQVGPTRTYTAPSKVMGLVSNGDTVEIDAGLYSGDVGTWSKSNLLIRCPNGMAHLEAAGRNAGGKAIWVISGNNTRIENIEFSGCTVPDKNGAGIRQEGAGLELRHCYLHDNEDGVLAGANTASDILFEACEFARNGYGDGYSHNIYIGNIRTFTMRFCYSHHAKIGHCVKSRAMNNYILYCRIMDEDTGSASYLINLPNGGFSVVLGNTMMKGPNAQNRTLVDYGSEGLTNPAKQLYVVNNTMVSLRPSGATFVAVAAGTDTARIINNILAGTGTIFSGPADTISNAIDTKIGDFSFLDASKFDYHLSSSAIHVWPIYDIDAGSAGSFSLTPTFEYLHPTDSLARNDQFIGAFNNVSAGISSSKAPELSGVNFPNPFSEKTDILLDNNEDGTTVSILLYNQLGAVMQTRRYTVTNSHITFESGNLPTGIYYYDIRNTEARSVAHGKFVID